MNTAPQAPPTSPPLWRIRSYWHWLVSDTGQALGASLQQFLIPILVAIVTGDAAMAGTIAAVGLAAQMSTTLLSGVLADRHDLRRLMVVGGFLAAGLMVAISISIEAGWGLLALGVLNALAGVRAGLTGGSNAALKQVVPSHHLPTASSANQARDAAVAMGGAPLGGVLAGIAPLLALLVTAGSYLVSAVAALFMRGDFLPDRSAGRSSVVQETTEGLRWLWARRELRTVLMVALLLNLGLATVVAALMYHYATQGEDPARIGLISFALGFGMLVGAGIAAPVVQRFRSGRLALVGVSGIAVAALLLPLSPGFWWTLGILAFGIMGAPMANAALLSYFMHRVPRSVLGRATSALELIAGGATPLAPVLAGWGLVLVGLQPTLIVAGAIILGAVAFLFTDRHLRGLPTPSEWEAVEPGATGPAST